MNVPFVKRQRKATMAGRPLGHMLGPIRSDGEEQESQRFDNHDMVTQTLIIMLLHKH